MTGEFQYQGDELELFALALRWKTYFASKLTPYFGLRILEVGAGFGAVTRHLLSERVARWTCLEPDSSLSARIPDTLANHPSRDRVEVICGTTAELVSYQSYDTVVYVDVLEHIEDDAGELRRAANLLSPGGSIIVLSPSFQWLYTPFDRALGHFRRYDAKTLRGRGPAGMECERIFYLDSAGLLASLGNKLFLRQSLPSKAQILFWDRRLVPLSRVLDSMIRFSFGRSIVAVWRATDRRH